LRELKTFANECHEGSESQPVCRGVLVKGLLGEPQEIADGLPLNLHLTPPVGVFEELGHPVDHRSFSGKPPPESMAIGYFVVRYLLTYEFRRPD